MTMGVLCQGCQFGRGSGRADGSVADAGLVRLSFGYRLGWLMDELVVLHF